MRVCVLSDLHLGPAGGAQNDFRFSDAAFAAILRRLAADHDWLILNGDIFEMWEPDVAALPQTEKLFKKICEGWPEIVGVINETRNIIPLTGNHDSSVHLHGWLPKVRTEVLVPELSLFVAHGHQGDRKWCAEDSPFLGFVRCLACCVGYGEILVDPDFDETVSRFKNLANRETDGKLADYAFAVAERLGVKVVCFGHTHQAELLTQGAKIYVNCGKCVGVDDRVQFAVIQGEGGEIRAELGSLDVLSALVLGWPSGAGPPQRTQASITFKCERKTSPLALSGSFRLGQPPPEDVAATKYSKGGLVLSGAQVCTSPGSFLLPYI